MSPAGMPTNRPALSAARIAVQLTGFAIGAALLAWCIMPNHVHVLNNLATC